MLFCVVKCAPNLLITVNLFRYLPILIFRRGGLKFGLEIYCGEGGRMDRKEVVPNWGYNAIGSWTRKCDWLEPSMRVRPCGFVVERCHRVFVRTPAQLNFSPPNTSPYSYLTHLPAVSPCRQILPDCSISLNRRLDSTSLHFTWLRLSLYPITLLCNVFE